MDWPCLSITPDEKVGGNLNSNKLPGKMKFGIVMNLSKSSDFKNDEMEGVDFRNGCPSLAISRSAACDDYVEMAGPLRWRLIGMENGTRYQLFFSFKYTDSNLGT